MTEGGGDEKDEAVARVAAMRRLDWGRVTKRLVLSARRLGASSADAQDIVQHVIDRMVRADLFGWDFRADPTARRYLLRKVDHRMRRLRDKESLRQELRPTELSSDKAEAAPPESDRGAEGELLTGEAALRNLERLRKSLAGSPLALALVDLCAVEGQLNPRDIAERLAVPVERVYIAEAQVRRHVKRLRGDGSDPEIRASAEADAEELA